MKRMLVACALLLVGSAGAEVFYWRDVEQKCEWTYEIIEAGRAQVLRYFPMNDGTEVGDVSVVKIPAFIVDDAGTSNVVAYVGGGAETFSECPPGATVYVPASVESVGRHAFVRRDDATGGFAALAGVVFANPQANIDLYAFVDIDYDTAVNHAYFPASLKVVNNGVAVTPVAWLGEDGVRYESLMAALEIGRAHV